MNKVVLPELGEGIQKAVIACWHCKVGDRVNAQDDLVEVVTDKAVFNVPSGVSGTVKQILAREEEEVAIGQQLVLIE